jgi:hypothetical protein
MEVIMRIIEWNINQRSNWNAKGSIPVWVSDEINKLKPEVAIITEFSKTLNWLNEFAYKLNEYNVFTSTNPRGNEILIAVKKEIKIIAIKELPFQQLTANFLQINVEHQGKPLTIIGVRIKIDDKINELNQLSAYLGSLDAENVIVLGNSRCKYVEFTKRCDIYSLLRCMTNAFEYYGGVPETVLTDRMKTVITGSEAGKPIWNSRFEDFASEMGFVPKVCRVRKPQTKGKVERLVNYVKDNFLPGRKFKDLYDLNSQALMWCRKVDSKVHGTTGEIPLEALSKEPLLPLPDKAVRDKYRWETRKVTRDGVVSYDGAKYGIPWQYSGRDVRVRIFGGFFEVYYGEVRIARHRTEYASGRIVWFKGQYQGLAEKGGIAVPLPFARKEGTESVEIRPLSVYDALAGVISNG